MYKKNETINKNFKMTSNACSNTLNIKTTDTFLF